MFGYETCAFLESAELDVLPLAGLRRDENVVSEF
jgi:hypothetical protein